MEAALSYPPAQLLLKSHHTNHPSKTNKTCKTLFSYELLPMDTPVLASEQKLTFINSVKTLDTVKRTYQES